MVYLVKPFDYEGTVARGAAFLDGVKPDWRNLLRHVIRYAQPFDVQSASCCVLSHAFAEEAGAAAAEFDDSDGETWAVSGYEWATSGGLFDEWEAEDASVRYGFALGFEARKNGASYEELTAAWRELLATP